MTPVLNNPFYDVELRHMYKLFSCCVQVGMILILASLGGNNARAEDWPQWRGVHRDAVSHETGLLQEWPKDGPGQAWKATGLGKAYSSVAVANGKIFTMGDLEAPDKGEAVIALQASGGKKIWSAKVGEPWSDGGPR